MGAHGLHVHPAPGVTIDYFAAGAGPAVVLVHGIDPGPDYREWSVGRIATASVEVWPDLGHYPHLVATDRFVERVVEFDPALTRAPSLAGRATAVGRGARSLSRRSATPGRPGRA